VPPFSSPFSWSITRSGVEGNANDDNDKLETKKEIGLVSRERQLVRLRERMAEGGVLASRKQEVPCRRCVDRVVTP